MSFVPQISDPEAHEILRRHVDHQPLELIIDSENRIELFCRACSNGLVEFLPQPQAALRTNA